MTELETEQSKEIERLNQIVAILEKRVENLKIWNESLQRSLDRKNTQS